MVRSSTTSSEEVLVNWEKLSNVLPRKVETKSSLHTELLHTGGATQNNHNNLSTTLRTYNGNQYCAFYNATRVLVLGKRSIGPTGLPTSAWTVDGTGITIADLDDNHRGISLGFDEDGFIHVAWGMHSSPLQYFKMPTSESIAGDPIVLDSFLGTANENSVTYPMFFNNSAGKLFIMMRHTIEAGNGDQYILSYTAGSVNSWTAAAGTGTNGIVVDGQNSVPTVSIYTSFPYIDSNDVAHFTGTQREVGGGTENKNPVYFAYDMFNGTFLRADGTAQTIPITSANAEVIDTVPVGSLLSQNNIVRNIYFDGTNIHIFKQYEDAGSVQQIFYSKHDGTSWTNTAITRRAQSPSWFNPDTHLFVDPSSGYFYVIVWDLERDSALTVYESRDSGKTWFPPYSVFESQRSDQWSNVDHVMWDTYGRFNRLFQYSMDEDGLGEQTQGTLRHVFVNSWKPSEGKSGSGNATKDIIHVSDINIHSELGTVNVGSEKDENGITAMKVHCGDGSGAVFSGLDVTKAGGRILIGNSGSAQDEFHPIVNILPVGGSNVRYAHRMEVAVADDTGTEAIEFKDYRRVGNTIIQNRPLVRWANAGADPIGATTFLQINADGTFQLPSFTTANLPAGSPDGSLAFDSTIGKGVVRSGGAWQAFSV